MMIDLAPGGSQPYSMPGISEADSMQQLTTVPSASIYQRWNIDLRCGPAEPSGRQARPEPYAFFGGCDCCAQSRRLRNHGIAGPGYGD